MKARVQFDNPLLKIGGPGLDWRVQSLSWSLPGGADTARLEAALPAGMEMDWLAWLNTGLVVHTPDSRPMWSGVIEQVRVEQGQGGRVISMAELVNRVKVRYQRTGFSGEDGDPWLETDWLENAQSMRQYGRREVLLEAGQSSAQQAEAAGRFLLQRRAFPTDLPHAHTAQPPRVVLDCKGWWHSLRWVVDQETRGRICHLAGGKSSLVLGAETTNSKLAQSFVAPEDGFELDVFPLPRLPHLGLRQNSAGKWIDPNGIGGRLETAPVGRLAAFQQRQWVVLAARWSPHTGFVMTDLQEITPTLQD